VKLQCHLREARGERTLREISTATGVSQPDLSRIERGTLLPADVAVPLLEEAYGIPVTAWFPPQVLLAITGDETT
jgi:transcriptional regulator with XRE-family HTH domain